MKELTEAQREVLDKTVAAFEGDWQPMLNGFCERMGMTLQEAMLYRTMMNTENMRTMFVQFIEGLQENNSLAKEALPLMKRSVELMEQDRDEDGDWKP